MNKTKSPHKGFNVQGNLLEDVPFSEEHPQLVAVAKFGSAGHTNNTRLYYISNIIEITNDKINAGYK